MSDEKRQILNMLVDKKITVDEAERLLQALGEKSSEKPQCEGHRHEKPGSTGKRPKYLYISVKPKEGEGSRGEKINITIPLFLLRTGLKIGGILPDSAKEKINKALGGSGIDLEKLNETDFEDMIDGLSEMAITVDDEKEKISIYCD